jgi:DNA polymerase I-like protein with 3'-5' exonuclease and polymerase domains
MRRIHMDCETRSRINIWDAGAYVYAADHSTKLMCLAYAIDNDPVKVIRWDDILAWPLIDPFEELRELASADDTLFYCHNSLFEQLIFKHIVCPQFNFPRLPINRWRCTAAKALAHGLPKALKDVATALGTGHQKDLGGRAVMLKVCKPKSDGSWEESPDLIRQLEDYCAQDVETERDIDNQLPELHPKEQYVWFEDQLINQRGIAVDEEALDKALVLISQETENLKQQIVKLTDGALDGVSRRNAVLAYFKKKGVVLPDFTKATVENALRSGKIPSELAQVLRIRQQLGLTSTAKYVALKDALCEDSRLRDTTVYHSASTGRWCMPGSAEVLTPQGWVKLKNWKRGEILTWTAGQFFWDKTATANVFDFFDRVIRIDHRYLKGKFTPEHIFAVQSGAKFKVKEAWRLASGDNIPISGMKPGTVDENITRAKVMLQADGSVRTNKAQGRCVRFGFRKMRKIIRAQQILTAASIPFTLRKDKDATRITVRWDDAPEWFRQKHFDASILDHDAKVFIDELKHWDSSVDKRNKTGGFEFSSTHRADAEWAATMAHLAGYAATVTPRSRQRAVWNTSYRVQIRKRSYIQIRTNNLSSQLFAGKVYCPSTTSGFFLCRYNGYIFISGNSGKLVQMQNLPRGTVKDTDTAVELLKENDIDTLRMLYDNVMGLLSSCVRGMFIAPPGHDLVVADYNAIEARVLMWMAGQDDAVKMFAEGKDIYVEMAKRIGQGATRQLGKQAVLGAGFGMSSKKFQATCASYGIEISEALAERAIGAYRGTFSKVPAMWYAQEQAMRTAITTKMKVDCGKTAWAWDARGRDFLYCTLPSGRRLAYHKAAIIGGKITYYTTNSMTKKYEKSDIYSSKVVENIVQATARDIMAWAMLRAEKAGYKIVLTVHDELVAEVEERFGGVEEFIKIITAIPEWAVGCPINAEGWRGKRYKKG